MDKNQKGFNLYVFFSTFARNLIEFFIGTILYKAGFSVQDVIGFYALVYLVCTLITIPAVSLSKRFDNRVLSFISIGAFILLQYLLNTIVQTTLYIVIIATLYGIYRVCYWTARRYYNLKVMKKEKIASSYSIISIINQVSIIVSSYIGSLFLDFISIRMLTTISMIIFILSVVGLYKLKFDNEKNDEKLDFIGTLKQIPKSNMYLITSYELITLYKVIVPLYIFVYLSNNYQTIGLITLISNIATIIVTYLYGKCIDNDKNFYKACILLTAVIFILKVNVDMKVLYIVSFFDGIFQKMYELSISKEVYLESKKFEYYNFNMVLEFMLNLFRFVVVIFMYFFIDDLRYMVYLVSLCLLIGVFFNFKEIKKSEYSVKKKN